MTYSRVEHVTETGLGRRVRRRRRIERLLLAAQGLPPEQRRLLEGVYRDGIAPAELARQNGEETRNLQRRLARLTRKVRSPLFRFAAQPPAFVPQPTRQIARLIVLRGLSQRDTAQLTGQSLHQVRMHMQTVMTLCELTEKAGGRNDE